MTIIPAQLEFGGSAPFPVAQNHSGFRFPFSLGDYAGSWRRRGQGGEPGEWFAFDLAQQFCLHKRTTGGFAQGSGKPPVMEVTQRAVGFSWQ